MSRVARRVDHTAKLLAALAALALFYAQVPIDALPEVMRQPLIYTSLAVGTSYAATTDLRATVQALLIALVAVALSRKPQ